MVGMLLASVVLVLFLLTSGGPARAPMTETEAGAKAKLIVTVVAAIAVTVFLFTARLMIDHPRVARGMTPFAPLLVSFVFPGHSGTHDGGARPLISLGWSRQY